MKFLNLKSKSSSIEIYDNIDVLPLHNFDRFMATKDNNWFLKSFDGRQVKQNLPILKETENDILDQYFKAIDDKGFQAKIQKWAKIDFLFLKFETVKALIDRMFLGFTDENTRFLFILELEKWGFKMPKMANKLEDNVYLEQIKQQLNGIKTQIQKIKDELSIDGQKESKSLNQQLQIATRALDYKFMLKAKEITVAEWISICKEIDELAKQN